jgi:hypothetical protein
MGVRFFRLALAGVSVFMLVALVCWRLSATQHRSANSIVPIYWLNDSRFDRFPFGPDTESYFPRGPRGTLITVDNACQTGTGLAYFSVSDDAIIVHHKERLDMLRLPHGMSRHVTWHQVEARGNDLLLNLDDAAYEVDTVSNRIRRLPGAARAFAGHSPGTLLVIYTSGRVAEVSDDRQLKVVNDKAILPKFLRSDIAIFEYDPVNDVLVANGSETTWVYYRRRWNSFPFGNLLLDTMNGLLWADNPQPLGLGEDHYCFRYDGSIVVINDIGDYPLGSPSQALDAKLVRSLLRASPRLYETNLSLTESTAW